LDAVAARFCLPTRAARIERGDARRELQRANHSAKHRWVKWRLPQEREAGMLEYVFRFTVDRGRQNEVIEWLRTNEENLKNHTRPGWTYLGTWLTVGGFGDYDGESRWALESYASLGEGWGDETAQRLLSEFFGMVDHVNREANLLRSVATVQSAPNM
jgi:hypothetical protein